MVRVLVTGGTGALGRRVVAQLMAAGASVRVLTRSEVAAVPAGVEAARGDLATGAGVAVAVADTEIVVHAASRGTDDVADTERLVAASRAAGVRHLLYISIVGVDRHSFAYYRAKLAAEGAIERGGVPWTIQRATQFHSLGVRVFAAQRRLPVLLVARGFRFQPVDEGEVAARLTTLALAPPAGSAPDMGGPEILAFGEMAQGYRAVIGSRKPVLGVPLFGAAAAAFRTGVQLAPAHRDGTITWYAYLQTHIGATKGRGNSTRHEEAGNARTI